MEIPNTLYIIILLLKIRIKVFTITTGMILLRKGTRKGTSKAYMAPMKDSMGIVKHMKSDIKVPSQ